MGLYGASRKKRRHDVVPTLRDLGQAQKFILQSEAIGRRP
jgi:hypothetical protein